MIFSRQTLGLMLFLCAPFVNAGIIISPIAATADSTYGNDPHYEIENTIDQSGLYSGFTSGVTDFDSYIASNPFHDYLAPDNEWFGSQKGIQVANGIVHYPKDKVTFDLGLDYELDKFALWNEENGGIRRADISISSDGINFVNLMSVTPVGNQYQNNANGIDHSFDYLPEVFSFSSTITARYFQFDLVCPNNNSVFAGCSMGEIAFSATNISSVPEPATLLLLTGGVLAFGFRSRKQLTATHH